MPQQFAISTATWIRTDDERQIVLETLHHLDQLGIPMIVADRSEQKDKQQIASFANVSLIEAEGYTQQLLQSHLQASRVAEYIIYLQSDKLQFAKAYCQQILTTYSQLSQKGMLVVARTKEALSSYPLYQQKHEALLNFVLSDFVGVEQDYFSCTRIFPSSLVNYFSQIKGDICVGIEAYLYVIAHRLGLPFNFVSLPIVAPVDIGDEQKIKLYRDKVSKWELDGFLQGQEVTL